MPENEPQLRQSEKLQKRVEELERVVKVLCEAQKAREEEEGDEYVKAGEYYGVKFE